MEDMSKKPMRIPESRWPEMEHSVKIPGVVPPKLNKGTLWELLDEMPEDLRRRVQSMWVGADGDVSIDFAPEDGGTSGEAERE